jgi:hypothetical protein
MLHGAEYWSIYAWKYCKATERSRIFRNLYFVHIIAATTLEPDKQKNIGE